MMGSEMTPFSMKDILCLSGFDAEGCCGYTREEFIHGVKIINGRSVLNIIEYPFKVVLKKKSFIITKDGVEYHGKIKEFNQSYDQIKDLFSKCIFGQFHNELKRIRFQYVVDDGNQNTFLCPIDGEYLGAEYYDVFVNTTQVQQGTNELEYIVVDGQVFFTVAIPDITGDESLPHIVNITLWYKG